MTGEPLESAPTPVDHRAPRWAAWDDDPNSPPCDRCTAFARWSICNLEGPDLGPVVRWFACGLHLNGVLAHGCWEVDSVTIYDLTGAHS